MFYFFIFYELLSQLLWFCAGGHCSYRGCCVLSGLSQLGALLAITLGGVVASRQLHTSLLLNVLRSPVSFFEVTPSGNLLNRFSREIDAIDCMVPDGLKMMLSYLFKLLEVVVVLLLATPLAGLVILPLVFVYVFIQVTFFPEVLH